jgi:redox-sensing transcriptional repressor
MQELEKTPGLPLPTIRRYPIYLRAINAKIAQGELNVSSAVLARELDIDPVVARKDLAMAGVPGTPRRGYPAKELTEAINRALGWDNTTDAALIGVGSLGHALLGYRGFEEQNLSIAVAFDANAALVGTTCHGVKIRAMADIPKLVPRLKLKLGILTVPNAAAQDCADQLVTAGIRGIWNFTAVQLVVPKDVKVQHVDLASSLAVLSHTIATSPNA